MYQSTIWAAENRTCNAFDSAWVDLFGNWYAVLVYLVFRVMYLVFGTWMGVFGILAR